MAFLEKVKSFFDSFKDFIIAGTKPKPQAKVGAEIVRTVLQETAKSGAAIGLTLASPFTKRFELTAADLSPTVNRFKELIFGKGPLKSLQARIAEAEIKTAKFGRERGIPFIERGALPLAILGVGAVVGLDFTLGGGKDDIVRLLTRVDNVGDTANVLRKIGVAEDLITPYSKAIASSTDAKKISQALDSINDIQKGTKVADIIKPARGFKFKQRRFLQNVSKARPDIQLKAGGQYVPRSTDRLAIKARTTIQENIELAEKMARTGTNDASVATAAELIKHYSDEALKATDKAAKNVFYDKASDVAHTTARNLTEQGRAIQAASIMGRQTPEGMLRFAAREINKYNDEISKGRKGIISFRRKLPNITTEQSEFILKEGKRIQNMADGTAKAMEFKKLNDFILSLVPTPFYKKMIGVWKAGLLTGIKTSGLNTFSNLFHGASEIIKDVPAVVVDKVASIVTGKRTIGLTLRGSIEGTVEGFKKGWRYLTTGFDERNVGAKLDFQKISFGKGKVAKAVQRYEETVFHILGAEDQPFFYGAKARSMYSQAVAKAKNAGRKGKEATKFIDDLVSNPTDDMIRRAVADAEIAVFQNETTFGKIARAIQKAPGGEIVVPFGRTPASVATQLINYSPAGIVKTIASNIGKGRFDQKMFAQGIGRGITGTAVMWLGSQLYNNDMIALDFPDTEKEQALWKAEGKKPNSIKIGGKWRSVAVLGPAGFTLLAGGHYQKGMDETGSHIGGLTQASLGGVKSLKEQTFLQGINQMVSALDDPERFGESYFANLVSSLIPTLIGDVARAKDPLERRATGILGRSISKIPGARETLEPQIDILGRERVRGGGFVETMIDPSRPVKDISTPVTLELRRLFDLGFNATPTQLGDRNGYDALTPQQNTVLWQKAGELLNSKLSGLFESKEYKALDNDQKDKLIKGFVDKSYIIARVQLLMDLIEGMAGETLKNELSRLKADGFLTREVFNTYLKLR